MRRNFNKLPFIFSILLFLFFTGCKQGTVDPNDKVSAEKAAANSISKTDKDSGAILGKIVPMRPVNCVDGRLRVYHNNLEAQNLFRPASGKTIGVMCDGDNSRNQNYLTQYGCSMVLVTDYTLISTLNADGYALDQIYIGLNPNSDWRAIVDQATNAGVVHFYIDEPAAHYWQTFVKNAAAYISGMNGDLTISESEFNYAAWIANKGDIGSMIDIALDAWPRPFVCCHTHFEYHTLYTIDPRDQWSYIKSRVPDLFKMVIIKTRQNSSEMSLLYGHANNLGINKAFLYPFNENNDYLGIQSAIETGHMSQWVQQYFLQTREEWCCPTIEFDPSECSYDTKSYVGDLWN